MRRTVTVIAAGMAAIVAILLPSGYLLRAYYLERTGMEAEADLYALRATEIVNRNPTLWSFQLERLADLVDRDLVETDHLEVRSLVKQDGTVLASSAGVLSSPVLTARHEIYDAGRVVGEVRISRSMLVSWQRAAGVAVLSFALGLAMFVSLRLLPLRALDRALASLAQEKERLRVVVDSAMDGIFSLDRYTRIESLNPAAERIFGYPSQEARGQPLCVLLPGLDVSAVLMGARSIVGEGEGRRRDESRFPVEYAVSRAEGSDSEFRLIGIVRDITERRQSQEALARLANYDTLTGLPNRNLFRDRLRQALARAKRSGTLAALVFLDLDRFKIINDTLGHSVGDELLQAVAKRIRETLRETDSVVHMEDGLRPEGAGNSSVSRLGGDEFTMILEDLERPSQAAPVVQRILDAIGRPLPLAGRLLYVTASAGIAVYPSDDGDADNLLKNADAAMYRAKELGRNSYQFFSEQINRKAHERLELELRLRDALARKEFSLHFHPQLDILTYRMGSVEALLRWDNPEFGSVEPARFIPVLEETGLISEVGEWVLRSACRWARGWQDSGLPPLRVAVNLSARQFHLGNLELIVEGALRDAGLDAAWLELDITENLVMDHSEAVINTLNALSARGVRITVDDFGTGYSSLAYLKRFPIRALKIDVSFVRNITHDANDAAITQAIIALGRSLGLNVVAEGVENEGQLAFLAQRGCNEFQGFLVSRPVPEQELRQWYGSWEARLPPGLRAATADHGGASQDAAA
ncbi:MAG TPA: EAL domain-containing protein [Burkholderiales bacterium]|nr:EAL domain-containing protein [Burkholderiales bacterium]